MSEPWTIERPDDSTWVYRTFPPDSISPRLPLGHISALIVATCSACGLISTPRAHFPLDTWPRKLNLCSLPVPLNINEMWAFSSCAIIENRLMYMLVWLACCTIQTIVPG